MTIANDVYIWWFWGLGGLGGWSLFLLFAVAAAAYVYFDSATRDIKAIGWRLGTILPMLLFIPTLLFRFANPNQPIDPQASEWFLVVGVLGAVIAIASAVGYAVTYWGVEPQKQEAQPVNPLPPTRPPTPRPQVHSTSRPAPRRPNAGAWLIDQNGHQYQLFVGDTRLGRRSQGNDIVFTNETVSREHALIREENGLYRIFDRGSAGGTFVNGKRLREPQILYHGDIVELGAVQLTFVTTQG